MGSAERPRRTLLVNCGGGSDDNATGDGDGDGSGGTADGSGGDGSGAADPSGGASSGGSESTGGGMGGDDPTGGMGGELSTGGSAASGGSTSSGGTVAVDETAPTLESSTPVDDAMGVAPCAGDPCRATLVFKFSESMNPLTNQEFQVWFDHQSTLTEASNSRASFAWSDDDVENDTLTVTMPWVWFPSRSRIQIRLDAEGLEDVAGNAIDADIEHTYNIGVFDQTLPLANSGHTECFGATASSGGACPNASFPSQDGDFVSPNARSFTGPTAHVTYTDNYTTSDNVTGLVWKTCSEGLSGADCSAGANAPASWYDAVDQCSALNDANSGAGYAGLTSWRLPTLHEMISLLDYSRSPSIDATGFPVQFTTQYITETGDPGQEAQIHSVDFRYGTVEDLTRDTTRPVRCVASPDAVSFADYTDNSNGTVTDLTTGLVWQKCSHGQSGADCSIGAPTWGTWQEALQYCDGLTLGGSSDWRLPAMGELYSIFHPSHGAVPIDPTMFPGTGNQNYWSSTTAVGLDTVANRIYFRDGGDHAIGLKAQISYYRCVTGE